MNCKDKGYKVGQVFEVNGSSTFSDGSIVLLEDSPEYSSSDDCPQFYLLKGLSTGGFSSKRGNVYINNVKRIWPPEDKISIILNGVETEISLASAKALKECLKDV